MIDKVLLGSNTAKNGFSSEREIAEKFNNWQQDTEAKQWLVLMQYNLNKIEFVKATIVTGHKTDVNVQIQIKLKQALDIENLQVKLVSNKKGFNQIDKRWIKNYIEMWNIPDEIVSILEHYVGELPPKINKPRDVRRMFLDEFSIEEQNLLVTFFDKNKVMIVNDILKGRGKFSADWILVAQKTEKNARWVLKAMNEAVNHYFGNGTVSITEKGSLKIGRITIQRKGGDGGRATANMLQFKIDPTDLFDI